MNSRVRSAALRPQRTLSTQAAARHGVIDLTPSLALQPARQGSTEHALCSGRTDTDLLHGSMAKVV